MTRRKKKLLITSLSALTFLWIACSAVPPWYFQRSILSQVAEADTLIVDFNAFPPDNSMHEKLRAMPAITIQGNARVRDFLAQLRFRTQLFPFYGHCRCFGEQAFRFERDGQELGVLTFHHHESLRWRSLDNRTMNYDLTQSSVADVDAWLERQAGPTLREAEKQSEVVWEKMRATLYTLESAATQPASTTAAE